MKIESQRTVESNFGDLKSRKVDIAANGKMFYAFVRGIYENKIRAFCREITTNAFDSHIEAGKPEAPFHVSFPDVFDPYFRVRDYGISMTDETVWDVFCRLGLSTKDDSNDVVGAFGLGSKSPLAYADTFEVTAVLDNEQRTYLVSLDEEGTPTITLLGTMVSDKPTGIEVAVPIKENDFHRVLSEGKDVLRAFDVLPTTNGVELDGMNVVHSIGDGSAMVCAHDGYPSVEVRQGCVLYPVNDYDLIGAARDALNYNFKLVLDVPIGTVGVTTSREALELDEATRANVQAGVELAVAEMANEINERFAHHATRVDAVRDYVTNGVADYYSGKVTYRGVALNNWLYLENDKFRNDELLPRAKAGNKRELVTLRSAQFHRIQQMKFVVKRSTDKVVRAGLRYRNFCDEHGQDNVYLLTDPDRRIIERMVRLWGLTSDQFVWIGNIPDPGKPDSGPRVTGKVSGVTTTSHRSWNNKVETLPEDYYWVEATRPSYWERSKIDDLRGSIIALGGDKLDIFIFSPTAAKRYKPAENRGAYAVEKALLEAERDAIIENYRMALAARYLDRNLREALEIEINESLADKANKLLGYDEREALATEAAELRAEWKTQFPLLIDPTDDDWKAYIADRL